MKQQEKYLYHQIHPVKLAADWGVTPLALYLFWKHKPVPGLLVAFGPAIAASWDILNYSKLEPYKQSPIGQYVSEYMTPSMQATRFAGFGVMALGAWWHRTWMMPAGLFVVLFGWLRGVIFPHPSRK